MFSLFNAKLKQENAELRADLENCQSEKMEAVKSMKKVLDKMALEIDVISEKLQTEKDNTKALRATIRLLKAQSK
jgi:hypothetical protein